MSFKLREKELLALHFWKMLEIHKFLLTKYLENIKNVRGPHLGSWLARCCPRTVPRSVLKPDFFWNKKTSKLSQMKNNNNKRIRIARKSNSNWNVIVRKLLQLHCQMIIYVCDIVAKCWQCSRVSGITLFFILYVILENVICV